MSTEKETTQEQKGKTIFIKYSTWKKDQHFITVMQTIPGTQKKVMIGKIYMVQGDEKSRFVAKSTDGKEVLGVAGNTSELEKHFIKHGPELAQAELQKKQEQTKTQSLPEEKAVPEIKAPEKEIEDIRTRTADKSKDQSLNR